MEITSRLNRKPQYSDVSLIDEPLKPVSNMVL